MKALPNPDSALHAARQRFVEALEAAEVAPECRMGVTAAAEAFAKAKAVAALAEFIDGRQSSQSLGPN
jgi:hypothetical protein